MRHRPNIAIETFKYVLNGVACLDVFYACILGETCVEVNWPLNVNIYVVNIQVRLLKGQQEVPNCCRDTAFAMSIDEQIRCPIGGLTPHLMGRYRCEIILEKAWPHDSLIPINEGNTTALKWTNVPSFGPSMQAGASLREHYSLKWWIGNSPNVLTWPYTFNYLFLGVYKVSKTWSTHSYYYTHEIDFPS